MAGIAGLLAVEDDVLDGVPVEELEVGITSFAGRMAAAMGMWLVWVAAFDRREGWKRWEQRSCAGWLNWKCGVELRTAREYVRVARALEERPKVRELLLAGELSYSKVRAITRVADELNEAELCEIALAATASQTEHMCRGLRDKNPRAAWEAGVVFDRKIDHGRIVLTCAVDDVARVQNHVEAGVTAIIDEAMTGAEGLGRGEVIESLGGIGAITAAVLIGLATGALDTAEGPFEDVMLVTDVDTLREHVEAPAEATTTAQASTCTDHARHVHEGECTFAGTWVPPVIARRLACDSRLQVAVEDSVGEALGLGREQRVVNRRLRRLLMRRDGGMCRFPGCGIRRRLHAHHVIHWADGGETELDNLIMVCHFHHHALHEGGWNIINKNGRFVFYDLTGRESRIEPLTNPTPDEPLPELVPLRRAGSAEPLAGWGERMNRTYVISTLLENAEVRRRRLEQQAAA